MELGAAEKLSVAHPTDKRTPPSAAPELTVRALVAGGVLGAVLAAANVYTALKTGYIDGGCITASVLSFIAFRAFGRSYGPLENNLTQTVASSAAVMSFVAGVAGPIPALARAGYTISNGVLVIWTIAIAVIGIAIGAALRSRLIAAEGLPFPTGTATAEVITAMAQARDHGMRRARGLLIAAAIAALIAWARDGAGLLPQSLELAALFGIAAGAHSIGVSVSPLMFATGLISGPRIGSSMLLGGLIAFGLISPALTRAGVVPPHDPGALVGWLLWPAVALVLSSSLTALALQWRTLARGVLDVRVMLTRGDARLSPLHVLVLIAIAVVIVIAQHAFDLGATTVVLAVLLSCALAVVCARGAGETDIAPAGDMGGLTQLVFGSRMHAGASLVCGGIATGTATQTAQTLWAFKAGHKLGANPRHQIFAQLIGAVVGAVVVVPTYHVIVLAYGLGSEKLPAISVLSWEATATAVRGGLSALPAHALTAAAVAFAVGSALTLLGKSRRGALAPSPVALGIGFLMPLPMTVTLALGALCFAILARRHPSWTRDHVESTAGGAIAGESLCAVILAALVAYG